MQETTTSPPLSINPERSFNGSVVRSNFPHTHVAHLIAHHTFKLRVIRSVLMRSDPVPCATRKIVYFTTPSQHHHRHLRTGDHNFISTVRAKHVINASHRPTFVYDTLPLRLVKLCSLNHSERVSEHQSCPKLKIMQMKSGEGRFGIQWGIMRPALGPCERGVLDGAGVHQLRFKGHRVDGKWGGLGICFLLL